MGPLNNCMNRINGWSQPINPTTGQPQGFARRHIATRVATACCFPQEIAAIVQNALLSVVQAPCAVLKLGVGTAACIFKSSDLLQKLNNKLPYSLTDFMRTVARVIGYAIGAFSTITLGALISPSANFRLHCALGLVSNQREAALKALLEKQELKKQEEVAEGILKTLLETQEAQEDIKDMLKNLSQSATKPVETIDPVVQNEAQSKPEQEVLREVPNENKGSEVQKEPAESIETGIPEATHFEESAAPGEESAAPGLNGINEEKEEVKQDPEGAEVKEEYVAKHIGEDSQQLGRSDKNSGVAKGRYKKYAPAKNQNWLVAKVGGLWETAASGISGAGRFGMRAAKGSLQMAKDVVFSG
jgi:hypothetical protein